MLPAILSQADPNRKSAQTEKASSEIANMLTVYKEVSGTSSKAQDASESATIAIKEAADSSRPILEISHDLWTQYRKREGQPMDQFVSRDAGVEVDESGPLDFLPCVGSSGESSCIIA